MFMMMDSYIIPKDQEDFNIVHPSTVLYQDTNTNVPHLLKQQCSKIR